MSKELFRQKSMEQMKSPDDLKNYIKVANPGIWLLLLAIIVILVGASIWGYFHIYQFL